MPLIHLSEKDKKLKGENVQKGLFKYIQFISKPAETENDKHLLLNQALDCW
jgi:hypothetical protein